MFFWVKYWLMIHACFTWSILLYLCVLALFSSERVTLYYTLFFWAHRCLRHRQCFFSVCVWVGRSVVSSVYLCSFFSLLIQLVGFRWSSLTFLLPLLPFFFSSHSLLSSLLWFSSSLAVFLFSCHLSLWPNIWSLKLFIPTPTLLLFFTFTFLLLLLLYSPLSPCQSQWLQGEVVELCTRLDPVSSSTGPGHQGSSHQPPMIASSPLTNPPFLWYS